MLAEKQLRKLVKKMIMLTVEKGT
jgi:hypothetical protein